MKLQFEPSFVARRDEFGGDAEALYFIDENIDISNQIDRLSLKTSDNFAGNSTLSPNEEIEDPNYLYFPAYYSLLRSNRKVNYLIFELWNAVLQGNDDRIVSILQEVNVLDNEKQKEIASKFKYCGKKIKSLALSNFIKSNISSSNDLNDASLTSIYNSVDQTFYKSKDYHITALNRWNSIDRGLLSSSKSTLFNIPEDLNQNLNEAVKFAAYYNIPTSKILFLSALSSKSKSFSEKIKAFLSHYKFSKLDEFNENESLESLSILILDALITRANCGENLLLLATSLKTSVKHLFSACTPKLLFYFLTEAGKNLRNGDRSDEWISYFALFPDNAFKLFYKTFVYELQTIFNADNQVDLNYVLNASFALIFFAKCSSLPSFMWIIKSMSALLKSLLPLHGEVVRQQVNVLLERLIQEAVNMDSNYHLAAIAKVAFDLNIKACIENDMNIKSRFSTLGNIHLFELLFPASFTEVPPIVSSSKNCIEILRDPKHPLKLLAVCGLKHLYSTALKQNDDLISDRISSLTATSLDLISFYPFYIELQDVIFGADASYDDYKILEFYSSSFIKLQNSGNLIDLLLVFVSSLLHKDANDTKSGTGKAFELCIERLLQLSKEKPSHVAETFAEYWIEEQDNVIDWTSILQAVDVIQVPASFSEWIFSMYIKALDYCKPFEKNCFQSLLPAALADPLSLIPILPVLIVMASLSQNINFMSAVFKAEVINIFDHTFFALDSIQVVLKVLQTIFNIFSGLFPADSAEFTTWQSQFTLSDICTLYNKTLRLNLLDFATFFMQLVWSIDSNKIPSKELYDVFVLAKDYKSALGVFSSETGFSSEKAVYTFMAERSNNYAEIGLKMMMKMGESKFDSIFLQNHALRSDLNSFNTHYNQLARKNPEKLELFEMVKLESHKVMKFDGLHLVPMKCIDYESERSFKMATRPNRPDSFVLENATILAEAKSLRRLKDFENAFHVLSKMDLNQDPFWNLKYYLELGNWFHASGKYNTAIQIFNSLSKEQKSSKLLSKIYRKLALSMNASRHFSDQEIMSAFERAIGSDRNCAKSYFELAMYLDSRNEKSVDETYSVLKHLARTLMYTRKFDHLAYPRFITIWLNSPGNEKRINDLIKTFIASASTGQAVNHLSQLISRIGHPDPNTVSLIETMIEKICLEYPDAALWKIASVIHSGNETRKSKASTLLLKVKIKDKQIKVDTFIEIAKLFISICNLEVTPEIQKINLSKELRTFKRLKADGTLVAAPNYTLVYTPEMKEDYNYIMSFEDNCIALSSLIRPKKLRFILSTTQHMTALLKPKDDLRRDSRFMELCYFLNSNFSKKRLKYGIKIFAVTPLNDECGIIEWVESTAGLRSILLKAYKKVGISIATRDLKDIMNLKISPYERFTKILLPKFPPVFMRWFFEKFPSVEKWNCAISDYSHSTAVMSMVGFIMGLGDRHGENILFDELSGACVHVDYNCLFDKGKTFEYPEKIPFRLTQNMVHALGAGGVEAKFKPASIVVMNCLWESKRSILTNLEAFLHDPLVDWVKPKKSIGTIYDITNEMATKTLKAVDRKLSGYIESENYSCEGQVEKLIQHATDKNLLSDLSRSVNHNVEFNFKIPLEVNMNDIFDVTINVYELPPEDTEFKYGDCRFTLKAQSELKTIRTILQDCKANSFLDIRIGPKEELSETPAMISSAIKPSESTTKTILSVGEKRILDEVFKKCYGNQINN